jgi:hypothetical protein
LDSLQKCCYQVPGEQQEPWLRYYCCKYSRKIQSLGVLNDLKNSFFEFALGYFSENINAVSEEQG